MITQGIKRWLKNLFAWWPWGRTSATEYVQAPSTTVTGTSQETLFSPPAEGLHTQPAQPGTTSVAVEPLQEEPPPQSGRLVSEESSPTKASFMKPADKNTSILKDEQKPTHEVPTHEMPSPTTEQRLEFLRYLVERGIVNEGDGY